MNKILITILFLFSSVCFAIPANQTCKNELEIDVLQESVDLSGNTQYLVGLNTYRANTYVGCNYFISFGKGSGTDYNRKLYLNYPSVSIPIQIVKGISDSSVLMDFPELNSYTNALSGSYPNYPIPNPPYYSFLIKLGTIPFEVPSGTYQDTFRISLYAGTLNNPDFEDSESVIVKYFVPKRIALSLVPTGSSFNEFATEINMNFGNMQTGLTLNFDTIIKSNSGYNLYFSSENGGKLMHESLGQYVGYTTTINGTNISLIPNTPVLVSSSTGATGADGKRLNVKFTLNGVNSQPSGNYKDYITVSVQSN